MEWQVVGGPTCPSLLGPSEQALLCKACSTHEVFLYTLPPKQRGSSSTNRRLQPSAPLEFDPTDEPPPHPPPCHPSPSPSSNSPTDPETSPDSPLTLIPHLPDSPSLLPSPTATWSHNQHMFPLRQVAGPEGPPEPMCHFHCQT